MFYKVLPLVVYPMEVSVLKETRNSLKLVTFEPWMDLKKNRYGSWKYYKTCYF